MPQGERREHRVYYCRRCHVGQALAGQPCRHAGVVHLAGLAGYAAGSLIGQGAHGRVYACAADEREWALKIIDLRQAISADEIRRLVGREAGALGRLRHRHIIALHHHGEDDDLLYLVTERLEETLRQRLQQPIALPRALDHAACLADALAYVHDAGALHRDLKPENIGFRLDGSLALFDFGLAADRTPGRKTRTTGVVGTWPYAAPEQILHKQGDAATDVYSLGAVLFELFTGGSHRPVPMRLDPLAWLDQPIPAWPASRALPAGVERLAEVIHACLAPDPDARPPVWQVQDALGELADRAHLDFAALVSERRRLEEAVGAARAEAADLHRKSEQQREATRRAREAQAGAEASLAELQAEAGRLAAEVADLRLERATLPSGPAAQAKAGPPPVPAIALRRERAALVSGRAVPGALVAPATANRPALRWVPAGTFTMGSPPDEPGRDDYEVQHPVTLTQPLWVMQTPVTQGEWAALLGTRPSFFAEAGDTCPVERVSWYEAVAFANALSAAEGLTPAYRVGQASGTLGGGLAKDTPWADGDFKYAAVERVAGADGYRLPTEAEWEWLARAGTPGAIYAGTFEILGEKNAPALDPIAWYGGNSDGKTHPVAQKAANPWGLHDVLGNVYEWCWDWYALDPAGPQQDPSGPPTGVPRVVRGGSWSAYARRVRSAVRVHSDPVWRNADVGFRLVRPPSSVEP